MLACVRVREMERWVGGRVGVEERFSMYKELLCIGVCTCFAVNGNFFSKDLDCVNRRAACRLTKTFDFAVPSGRHLYRFATQNDTATGCRDSKHRHARGHQHQAHCSHRVIRIKTHIRCVRAQGKIRACVCAQARTHGCAWTSAEMRW